MASYYLGVNVGGQTSAVAVSGSTTSKQVELVVVDTVLTKKDIVVALDQIKERLLQGTYPPV